MPVLTVILSTHNPHPGRLRRTVNGLCAQTIPVSDFEILLVNNASTTAVDLSDFGADTPANLRLIHEPRLGLSHARRRGFIEARGTIVVMVDDDNILAPDYLSQVVTRFSASPSVGALGGPCRPEFESPPQPWQHEFINLLALRDLGSAPLVAGLRTFNPSRDTYPDCAPIGAGMALRLIAVQAWLDHSDPDALTDRRGSELTSGGDNDIVIHVLRAGWDVAYFPELVLTHLIPATRLDPNYLARLNRGIQKSWMQLLLHHDLSNWPSIPRWTVPLRQFKAWFTYHAWRNPAARIRWQGACGHFEGRATPAV